MILAHEQDERASADYDVRASERAHRVTCQAFPLIPIRYFDRKLRHAPVVFKNVVEIAIHLI